MICLQTLWSCRTALLCCHHCCTYSARAPPCPLAWASLLHAQAGICCQHHTWRSHSQQPSHLLYGCSIAMTQLFATCLTPSALRLLSACTTCTTGPNLMACGGLPWQQAAVPKARLLGCSLEPPRTATFLQPCTMLGTVIGPCLVQCSSRASAPGLSHRRHSSMILPSDWFT